MDALLRETVNTVVNSRYPEMSSEARRQLESILIREEFPKGVIALNQGEIAKEIVLSKKVCSGNTYLFPFDKIQQLTKSYLLMTLETLSRVRSGVL